MKDHGKLISLLNVIDRKQLKTIKNVVMSPYYNQRRDVIELFEVLHEYIFDLNIIPSKEEIFNRVYPGKTYDAQQTRLIMSLLLKIIERHLVVSNVLNDSYEYEYRLATIYRKHKLEKPFQQSLTKLKTQLEKSKFQDDKFFNFKYLHALESYQFLSENQRTDKINLQSIFNEFDISFIAQKLRYICFGLSHQAVYKTEYDFGLSDELLMHIRKTQLLNIPAIALYYHYLLALKEPDQIHHFEAFRDLLFDHPDLFPKEEARNLYLAAINYCIKKLNSGQIDFAFEGLEIYKDGLLKDYFTEQKVLSHFTFNNIVAMALKVKDYQWVSTFINEYTPLLDHKHKENTYRFNMARLEYARKNYDAAQHLLIQSDFKDLLNNLIAKTLLSKIYFETDEHELLESHLDSLNTFIKRKRVMGYHRENYLRIVRYMKKLIQLNRYDKAAVTKFRQQITAEKALPEKEWLLKQLN